MRYRLVYSERAETRLAELPPALLNFVESELLRLADNPATLSRPSVSPPYPPNFQMYSFSHPQFDGLRWHFTVLFRYGADEMTLLIHGIGVARYAY